MEGEGKDEKRKINLFVGIRPKATAAVVVSPYTLLLGNMKRVT